MSWLRIPEQLDRIERWLVKLSAREDAAYQRLTELTSIIRDGMAAKDAEIRALTDELANAGASAQARVDAALEADSDFDAGRLEAADAALEELANVQPPPQPSPGDAPAPNGG